MKLLGSIAAYLFLAFLLAWGLLMAVQGSYWLLAAGALAYVIALVRIGCFPPASAC